MTSSCSDHGRIGFGSWSDRSRTLNDTPTVFGAFLGDFQLQICVAGAVFGEVAG